MYVIHLLFYGFYGSWVIDFWIFILVVACYLLFFVCVWISWFLSLFWFNNEFLKVSIVFHIEFTCGNYFWFWLLCYKHSRWKSYLKIVICNLNPFDFCHFRHLCLLLGICVINYYNYLKRKVVSYYSQHYLIV